MARRALAVVALGAVATLGCDGVANVNLDLAGPLPPRDGSLALRVAVAQTDAPERPLALSTQPFDDDLDDVSIRIPFGDDRMVSAAVVDPNPPERVVMGAVGFPFRLQEEDRIDVFLNLLAVPERSSAVVIESRSGRVPSSTITIEVVDPGAPFLQITEDDLPFQASDEIDLRMAPSRTDLDGDVLFRVSYALKRGCVGTGSCRKRIRMRAYVTRSFPSPEWSAGIILDLGPPAIVSERLRLDAPPSLPDRPLAALGLDATATVEVAFDEALLREPRAVARRLSGTDCALSLPVTCVGTGTARCTVPGRPAGLDCEGSYLLEVVATDLAGNSTPSTPLRLELEVDNVAPAPPLAGAVSSTCAGSLPLLVGAAGAVEPAAVVVASDGTVDHRGAAAADGSFVVPAPSGMLSVTQLDAAGNTSGASTVEVTACDR